MREANRNGERLRINFLLADRGMGPWVAGLGAAIGPALIMSLLWKRKTGPGVIVGMLVGIITVVVWK